MSKTDSRPQGSQSTAKEEPLPVRKNSAAGRMLLFLRQHPGKHSLSDVCEELGLKTPAASMAATKLEESGLIHKNRRPATLQERKRQPKARFVTDIALLKFNQDEVQTSGVEVQSSPDHPIPAKQAVQEILTKEEVERFQSQSPAHHAILHEKPALGDRIASTPPTEVHPEASFEVQNNKVEVQNEGQTAAQNDSSRGTKQLDVPTDVEFWKAKAAEFCREADQLVREKKLLEEELAEQKSLIIQLQQTFAKEKAELHRQLPSLDAQVTQLREKLVAEEERNASLLASLDRLEPLEVQLTQSRLEVAARKDQVIHLERQLQQRTEQANAALQTQRQQIFAQVAPYLELIHLNANKGQHARLRGLLGLPDDSKLSSYDLRDAIVKVIQG